MTRILPGVIAMAIVVVASNILVQFLILDGLLTWGAFTYPLAFLVTDIMNRVYGAGPARRVVFAGVIVGIICSLIGSQIMLEFGPAVALRVAIGSATAFLVAQLLDIAIFDRMRGGVWWKAPLTSTLISATIDTAIFFSIAFAAVFNGFSATAAEQIIWAQDAVPFLNAGPMVPLWVSLAVADWGVKIGYVLTDPTSEIQIRAIPYAGWPFFVGGICWGDEGHRHHRNRRLGTDRKLHPILWPRWPEREQGIHGCGIAVRGRTLPQYPRPREGQAAPHRGAKMDQRRRDCC